jgi:hypothetical protein
MNIRIQLPYFVEMQANREASQGSLIHVFRTSTWVDNSFKDLAKFPSYSCWLGASAELQLKINIASYIMRWLTVHCHSAYSSQGYFERTASSNSKCKSLCDPWIHHCGHVCRACIKKNYAGSEKHSPHKVRLGKVRLHHTLYMPQRASQRKFGRVKILKYTWLNKRNRS